MNEGRRTHLGIALVVVEEHAGKDPAGGVGLKVDAAPAVLPYLSNQDFNDCNT